MDREKVLFRGNSKGIELEVESKDFNRVLEELEFKLNKNKNFYKGVKIIDIKSSHLQLIELLELSYILKHKYNLSIDERVVENILLEMEEERKKLKDSKLKDVNEVDKVKIVDTLIDEGIDLDMTKFINGTIRSGQSIDYKGSIVVIGDVNPGAIIKATGHIIVLGRFRGVAQAGTLGNSQAIVAAYKLDPTQLRIGEVIARSPDKVIDRTRVRLPEIARIMEGKLIIEPYLPNK